MSGEKTYVDEWLKGQIKSGVTIINQVLSGAYSDKPCIYYSGHLHKDILENFPGRSSKKIFKHYKELLNNPNLEFFQKRFLEHGYDYYVRKVGIIETKKTA